LSRNTSGRSIAPVATITRRARMRQVRWIRPARVGARSVTSTRRASRTAQALACDRRRTSGQASSSATARATQSSASTPPMRSRRPVSVPPAVTPSSTSITRQPARAASRAALSPAGPQPTTSTSQWPWRTSYCPCEGGADGACARPATRRIHGSNQCQFGHMKARDRGLAKNRAQLFTLFALANLFLVRRRLIA
jgi:IS5 family transposase